MKINLNNLLDKHAAFENRFSKLASKLFDCCYIQVKNKTKLYFTELEFYYYDEQNEDWQDPFCLRLEDQKPEKEGYPFCFHTYGMDIVIGTHEAYGGVLVRGLKDEKGHFVQGPKRLFRLLLPLLDKKLESKIYSMKDHAALLKAAVMNEEIVLKYETSKPAEHSLMLQGPRIVGTRKDDTKFKEAPFRYIIDYRHNPCKQKESLLNWSACLHQKISLEQAIQFCGCGKVWQQKIIDAQKKLNRTL